MSLRVDIHLHNFPPSGAFCEKLCRKSLKFGSLEIFFIFSDSCTGFHLYIHLKYASERSLNRGVAADAMSYGKKYVQTFAVSLNKSGNIYMFNLFLFKIIT